MSNQKMVFDLIVEAYNNIFKQDKFLTPNIPPKKLNGAIKGIAGGVVSPNQVVLVYDSTLFGGAGEGMLLTMDTLYWKELLTDAKSVTYELIENAEYHRDVTVDKKGKETVTESVVVTTTDKEELKIFQDSNINLKLLADWLLKVKDAARQPSDNQGKLERQPLEAMPMEVRLAYIKVIINSLLADDGIIDEKEFSQLYSLIARLNIPAQERFSLLMYQSSPESEDTLVETMCQPLDELARQEIIFSLAKDLVYIQMQAKEGENCLEIPFIVQFARKYKISQEQLELCKTTIEADRKIFDESIDDSDLEEGFRNVAGIAAGLGVPLTALYLSGSVMGLGAAGITSGLAALGFGGLFGFSGMVTGFGVAILVGIGAKKGVDLLTGQSEMDKRKRKEALLLAINKHLQKSINILMEDINSFTARLAEEIAGRADLEEGLEEYEERMRRLVEQLRVLSKSGTHLSGESGSAELAAIRQMLPHQLNLTRLEAITSEPTTQEFRNIILQFYVEQKVTDSSGTETLVYVLRDDLTLDEASYLSELLKNLDYFSATSLAKQGLRSFGKLFG